MKKSKTTNALDILNRRHPPTEEDLKLRAAYQQQIEVAELIYQARADAGLSQRELADRVGTTASVICRLEDGDYGGHSLTMLRRIADALGQRVQVRFVRTAEQTEHRIISAAELAETLPILQKSLAEAKHGRGRPAKEILREIATAVGVELEK